MQMTPVWNPFAEDRMPVPVPVHRFTIKQYHEMIRTGILGEDDRVELDLLLVPVDLAGPELERTEVERRHTSERSNGSGALRTGETSPKFGTTTAAGRRARRPQTAALRGRGIERALGIRTLGARRGRRGAR